MKNEIINIYAEKEILFNSLITNKNFSKQFKILFFKLDDNKNFIINADQMNIFFIPSSYKISDCSSIFNFIKKLNPSQVIICLERKLSSFFSSLNENIIFIPLSFSELEKKIIFLKLSSTIIFDKLELNRLNNTLLNLATKSKVTLTQIEANIISILMKSKIEVSRIDLNTKALGYTKEVNSHSLDSHMYRLRKKLITISRKNKILAPTSGYYKII